MDNLEGKLSKNKEKELGKCNGVPHTGAKILSLSKNYHFGNLIFNKIHIFKFTFTKSHF